MELLGRLGIDIKLLIAQIINFGLLLWLLKKFLYKPIVKRIEEDEKELKQVRIQKERLEKEREIFTKKKQRDDIKSKEEARKIIEEAEYIAEKIKKDAYLEINQERRRILNQTELIVASRNKNEVDRQVKKALEKTRNGLKAYFAAFNKDKAFAGFHNYFLEDLLNQVKAVSLKDVDFSSVLEEESLLKKNKRTDLSEELFRLFREKFGPVILESAKPLTKVQREKINKMLNKKIGMRVGLEEKINSGLLAGFRLEFIGRVIESNLLNAINNATNIK